MLSRHCLSTRLIWSVGLWAALAGAPPFPSWADEFQKTNQRPEERTEGKAVGLAERCQKMLAIQVEIKEGFQVIRLAMLVTSAAPGRAQNQKDLGQLLKAKGPPTFTAKTIDPRGNLLICEGLEVLDWGEKKAVDELHGRVLLFCEPWDALWLWAAHTDLKMRRAAPFLGLEGPGKKFTEIAPAKMKEPSELLKPAKMFAASVDKTGKVVRTTEITVHKLQCKD